MNKEFQEYTEKLQQEWKRKIMKLNDKLWQAQKERVQLILKKWNKPSQKVNFSENTDKIMDIERRRLRWEIQTGQSKATFSSELLAEKSALNKSFEDFPVTGEEEALVHSLLFDTDDYFRSDRNALKLLVRQAFLPDVIAEGEEMNEIISKIREEKGQIARSTMQLWCNKRGKGVNSQTPKDLQDQGRASFMRLQKLQNHRLWERARIKYYDAIEEEIGEKFGTLDDTSSRNKFIENMKEFFDAKDGNAQRNIWERWLNFFSDYPHHFEMAEACLYLQNALEEKDRDIQEKEAMASRSVEAEPKSSFVASDSGGERIENARTQQNGSLAPEEIDTDDFMESTMRHIDRYKIAAEEGVSLDVAEQIQLRREFVLVVEKRFKREDTVDAGVEKAFPAPGSEGEGNVGVAREEVKDLTAADLYENLKRRSGKKISAGEAARLEKNRQKWEARQAAKKPEGK